MEENKEPVEKKELELEDLNYSVNATTYFYSFFVHLKKLGKSREEIADIMLNYLEKTYDRV